MAGELRPGWHTSETLEALRVLLDRGTAVHRVVARGAGLGDHEMAVLQHLVPGPVGPAEIARRLEVTSAAATGIVDRLVARGYAERRPHAVDRRRTEVHLTETGRAEVRGHLMPMFRAVVALDDQFDEAERAVVARYLRGAIAALDEVAGRGTDPRGT
ncbi:MarR family winged helix-turn-helix transcriptional regulator [Nocardioides zeae]|uniref:MarR family transcriptional regulator n=1 Tax=Nocardioides zeae TaxID=1457234 RepID=A0A6P0HHU4_9ACTN|nr:MarR family transcriptional regulator [Nocardioides zeae]NEN78213.1 MarR family transcriptional regulator [Nocardioides zeae]